MAVSTYYQYTFDEMSFADDLDPAESWKAYLEELKKESESEQDVFIFSNDWLKEALEEMEQRVVFEVQDGWYGPADSRIWLLKLSANEHYEENALTIHRYAVGAPLYDWMQKVIPRNRYGNDWVGTAIMTTEYDESYTCGFSINSQGVMNHRSTYGMGNEETWKPGYWRAKVTE